MALNYPKVIKKAFVSHTGDRSVGIRGAHFTVEMHVELESLNDEEKSEYIEVIRYKLKELYKCMDDEFHWQIQFDYEFEAMKAMEDEADRLQDDWDRWTDSGEDIPK